MSDERDRLQLAGAAFMLTFSLLLAWIARAGIKWDMFLGLLASGQLFAFIAFTRTLASFHLLTPLELQRVNSVAALAIFSALVTALAMRHIGERLIKRFG